MEKYAGFWVRFVAAMVDALVLFIPLGIINFIVALSAGHTNTVSAVILLKVIAVLIIWIYYSLMTFYKGATLGKMLVGITVKSADGLPLSFGRVILRETLGKIVSSVIFMIGYIIAAFTNKKQALHDMIAGTVVVYKDPANQNKIGLIIGIIIAVIVPIIAIFGIVSAIVLASLGGARTVAQDAATRSLISSMRSQMEVGMMNNKVYECNTPDSLKDVNVSCFVLNDSYAVSAKLNDGSYWCVDSIGKTGPGFATEEGTSAHCDMTK